MQTDLCNSEIKVLLAAAETLSSTFSRTSVSHRAGDEMSVWGVKEAVCAGGVLVCVLVGVCGLTCRTCGSRA